MLNSKLILVPGFQVSPFVLDAPLVLTAFWAKTGKNWGREGLRNCNEWFFPHDDVVGSPKVRTGMLQQVRKSAVVGGVSDL